MESGEVRILIVEDQRLMATDLSLSVQKLGYEVVGTAATGEDAIRLALAVQPTLVLMDIHLAGQMDGIQAASVIRETIDVPVVFLTAYADEETIVRAKVSVPYGYIVKPCSERELRATLEVALYLQRTERLLADERARRECAEEAERQKEALIAMLGHELRNPLAAIQSATELLKVSPAGSSAHGKAQAVLERQTLHIARFVDGLLDVSRMSRGRISIEIEPVDVCSVLRELMDDARCESGGPLLELQVPRSALWVSGDRVRLVQVFDNLLSNAIRFTEQRGSVTVKAIQEQDNVVVHVRDTGRGIEPGLLPRVFEPFWQGSEGLSGDSGGLGLGLSLVKGLVELHGGAVRVESAGVGYGSEFTVRLPVGPVPLPPSLEVPTPAARARILIVEDNADAAETLSAVLASSGHEVRIAHDGETALRVLGGFSADLILCDIGLPGPMSGYDVARVLRQTTGALLVALSGYGSPDDVRRSQEAGFDAHLTKPVAISTLQRLLVRHQRKLFSREER